MHPRARKMPAAVVQPDLKAALGCARNEILIPVAVDICGNDLHHAVAYRETLHAAVPRETNQQLRRAARDLDVVGDPIAVQVNINKEAAG
jgi:hypothetical protein